jgi:hypothetical protein
MSLSDIELNHDPDYKELVKAVINNAVTDYTKLQHPLNREKKYLKEGFLSAVEMFFDEKFSFHAFTSFETGKNLTTKDLLSIMGNSTDVNLDKTKDFIIKESINYWYDKNFHDIKIPSKIVIYGKVWFINNSQKNYIDFQKNKLYLPIKKIGSDRIFFNLVLKVMLAESNIVLSEEDFINFHKVFYLLLKVNNAFSTK